MVKPCPPLMPLSESAARCVRQSFAQSRLWFLHQMDPGRAQHNILVRLVLNGPQLVETRLKHAFNALCIRHPLLRACYRMTPAGPEQWLAAGQSIEVKQRDLSNLPAAEQKQAIDRLMHDEQNRPFDLESGPVIRACLLDLGLNVQELIIVIHHIAFDGRSGEILLQDLAHYYATQEPGALLPGRLQYADFAVWEPGYVTAELIEVETAFWRDHLAGMPLQLDFSKRPRPHGDTQGGRHQFVIQPLQVAHLKRASRAQRLPLFVMLTGLFQLWLHYLSGQRRFLIGTDVHGRDLPELQDIFGFFVNQLTLKCELEDGLPLGELLMRTRHAIRLAHAHRQLPFDLLVSQLAPQREAGRSPLFQTKFNYQRDRFSIDTLGDARIVRTQVIQDLAGFDLVLDLMHRHDSIEVTLEYDRRLFSPDEIERFAHLWQRLLGALDTLLELPISMLRERLQNWDDAHLQQQQHTLNNQGRARLGNTQRRAVSL
ncbi:MAG TPA: condensation domain-containing protein [Pseudomonas sp.]|nr:condensation domain-containing protein [Pseudomonas sp.]